METERLSPGMWLVGSFVGSEPRYKKETGELTGFSVLVAAGVNAYKVSVDTLPDGITFGTTVALSVRPRLYNGNIYYSGNINQGPVA